MLRTYSRYAKRQGVSQVIIKAYGGRPAQYAPDPGEIILARRAAVDKFTLAVVEKAWRNRDGHLRLRIVWLDNDPDAYVNDDPYRPGARLKVETGERCWLILRNKWGVSPLVRQIDADQLPRTPVRTLGS